MYFTRKSMSEASKTIFKEQRELTKERILGNPALIIGTIGFLVILTAAVFVPLISSADPNAMSVSERFRAPGGAYLFGTDEFGRDLFIRLMYGARVSLWVGGSVAVLSCVIGTLIGIYASYFKILDQILMRICDGLIAIPGILLAIRRIKLECSDCAYGCLHAECCQNSEGEGVGYSGTAVCGSCQGTGI